jgi:hypothetical protein
LGNAGNPVSLLDMREVEAAAGALGLTVFAVEIRRVEVLLPVWSGYVPFDPLLSTHQPDSHSATLGIPCGRTRILKLWHSRVHERIAQIFEHAIRSALNSRRSIWSLR